MIRYLTGNLLRADAEALVNTVNTVGVMGKGIALQFKEQFPDNYVKYRAAAASGQLETGKMFTTRIPTIEGNKWIINFPTKKHWRSSSQYNWIEQGLDDLKRVIVENNIKSIAIPPLGCGNGKLEWEKVRILIEETLGELEAIDIQIFSPNETIKGILRKEKNTKQAHLTIPRAELLYLLFHYEASGEESSLFIANKLAYFLQNLGEKQLRLSFKRHFYGPYSNQVDHLMYALNGTYLTGLEQRSAKAFERLDLNYSKYSEVKDFIQKELKPEQIQRLETLLDLIQGFESPLAMEALASVDSILRENSSASHEEVYYSIQEWNKRKKQIFTPFHIEVAFNRIRVFQKQLGYEA